MPPRSTVRPVVDLYHGVEARVIGFPPENESRAVTIDKGSRAGVRRDDGVLAADGVVGRVVAVAPFSSTVRARYGLHEPHSRQSCGAVAGGESRAEISTASSSSTFRRTRRCASATSS